MSGRLLGLLFVACAALTALIFVELWFDDPGLDAGPKPAPAIDKLVEPVPSLPRRENLTTSILAAPLFSPDRRPAGKAQTTASAPDLTDLRLAGIVIRPGLSLAIFAVAGAKSVVRLEGEALQGWRIDNISPTEISLTGPGGTRNLEPKPDRNLVRQVPSAQIPGQGRPVGPAATGVPERPRQANQPNATRPPPPLSPIHAPGTGFSQDRSRRPQ